MLKLSSAQVQAVLADVPDTMRKLAADRDNWRERALGLEQDQRLHKLADRMSEKGLDPDLDPEDRMARLREQAAAGKLEVMEQAVDLAAGRAPLGELSPDDTPGNGTDPLTSLLLGDLSSS